MAREDQHFRLRIPDELKLRVEAAARENRRSMTAEIIARLEASFAQMPSIPEEFREEQSRLAALLERIEKRLAAAGVPDA